MKYLSAFAVTFCFYLSSLHFANAAQPFDGTWKNQRGSTLIIHQVSETEFSGKFKTAVATTKSCIGFPIKIHGFKNGNAIALSMSLKECGSPTTISMVGSINNNQLDTLYLVQEKGKDAWNSRATNHDTYSRIR
ncbi:MAG: avidin/streptavidin family protein [Parashewanella sp.]